LIHLRLHSSVLDVLGARLLLPCRLVDVTDRSRRVEGRSIVLSDGVSLEDSFGKIGVRDKVSTDGGHIASPFNELFNVLSVMSRGGEDDRRSLWCGIFERRVGLGVVGWRGVRRDVDTSDDGSQGVVGLDNTLLGVLGLGLTSPVSRLDKVDVLLQ